MIISPGTPNHPETPIATYADTYNLGMEDRLALVRAAAPRIADILVASHVLPDCNFVGVTTNAMGFGRKEIPIIGGWRLGTYKEPRQFASSLHYPEVVDLIGQDRRIYVDGRAGTFSDTRGVGASRIELQLDRNGRARDGRKPDALEYSPRGGLGFPEQLSRIISGTDRLIVRHGIPAHRVIRD
jgi:hypothetical protein